MKTINHYKASFILIPDVQNPLININKHTAWLYTDNQTALTETGAFGSCTGTSRTQVSSPVNKFQLQVGPVEIHIIIIIILRFIKFKLSNNIGQNVIDSHAAESLHYNDKRISAPERLVNV